MTNEWIGVDLDGTLAEYHQFGAIDVIGAPVPEMVARVKRWLDAGIDVRIFTARAACPDPEEWARGLAAIERWCEEHIGQRLPVTCSKDIGMVECWDDRAVGVIPNTGIPVGLGGEGDGDDSGYHLPDHTSCLPASCPWADGDAPRCGCAGRPIMAHVARLARPARRRRR